MPAVSNVLVIGGGIGGLVAARALRQQGVAVDLIERESEWTVYGVGIIQPNNALRALDRVGIADRCIAAGGAFAGWRIHDANGNILVDAPGSNAAAPHLPANNGITRPRLHEILIEGAREVDVSIRLGVTATSIADEGASVRVAFSDGATRSYDFVLGYDGSHSQTRRLLFGEGLEPAFTGQGVWRYNLPRPASVDTGGVYFGPDTKVGLVPLSPTLMYMFVVTAEPDNRWFEGAGLADDMRARIAAYGGLVGELRDQIRNPEEVVYRPMLNGLVEGPWHRGRVMILGDAAHTTTPHLAQGAAMAIEDAVLFAELVGRGGELSRVLDAFMARRLDRARYVVDCSTKIGRWELEEWAGVDNPEADPGGLLHGATAALMSDY